MAEEKSSLVKMFSFEEEYQTMHYLTQKYLQEICRIWEQLFDPDVCKHNLRKLIEHATTFYSAVIEESVGRKEIILREISNLKNEADDLKRLLHIEIELPSFGTESVSLLRVQCEMDKSLVSFREQLRMRRGEIWALLLQQKVLCKDLGETQRALLADPLPTAEEMEEFKNHLSNLRVKRAERIKQIVTLRKEIRNFLEILDIQITCKTEDRLLNNRKLKMNMETCDGLNTMHSKYADQVKELKENIDAMRNKLASLWDCVQTSPNTREKFVRYTKYNQDTYQAIYNELERCERIKRQNVKQLVQQLREEMCEWWDKCLKSKVERERFVHYTCNIYSDDLLVLHEMELYDLKLHYDKNKPIYDLYAERADLLKRMSALDCKASERSRYNNRGGQLLKEEKERKVIAIKLPKLEQRIFELVKEYEEKEHRAFLVYGENIIDIMANQAKAQNARQYGATTVAAKSNRTMTTPMCPRNTISMTSLRKTPLAASLSVYATTAPKCKLRSSANTTLGAKRNLFSALSSSSVPLKSRSSPKIITPTGASTPQSSSKFISKLRKPKPVIGTIISRRSGRISCGTAKKRKSTK